MAKLVYGMMVSLDGYVAGPNNDIVGAITEEVHAFANEETRQHGTHLYGRRMYETMVSWETWDRLSDRPDYERAFAGIWRDIDKVVFSTTLTDVAGARTRIERAVDPDEIRRLKAADKDIAVAGPTLAAHFIKEGLVDEYSLYLTPVIVGGGTPYLRDVGRRIDLELIEERRFGNGVVFLRYRESAA
ncbi:MAG: dihydrofolate reductase family protein [Bauldia sp.]|nr:MAG: dihydrofolate reductase family protein [Bauldia sp.]MBZ0230267.1 dihydrofolate reductase family protein [Bauldia sp.]